MRKKFLIAACLLQLTSIYSTSLAAERPESKSEDTAIVSVDKCPTLSKITTEYVKYIGTEDKEELFLDKNGNQVVPCSKEDVVYFFITNKYPDGKELYEKSANPVLNQGFYDRAISINLNTDAVISYGKAHMEVTDIYDFQAQLKRKKLQESNKKVAMVGAEDTIPSDMQPYMQITEEMMSTLPETYERFTTSEKEHALTELYNKTFESVGQMYKENAPQALADFKTYAIDNNRLVKPTTKIIGQYSYDATLLDEVDDKGEPYVQMEDNDTEDLFNEIDGNLYLTYKENIAKADFYNHFNTHLTKVVCSNFYSTDQKLSYLEYLNKDIGIVNQWAAEYIKAQKHSFNKDNLDALNKQGLAEYNKLKIADKVSYHNLLRQINTQIINKEFNKLPEMITQKQYKSLSNIDKYKYAPSREGNFVDKSKYVKNQLELVQKYEVR